MVHIEFQTQINDGLIQLPLEQWEYLRQQTGSRRVWVTVRAQEATPLPETDIIAQWLANPLPVPHFVPLTREEAHERQ